MYPSKCPECGGKISESLGPLEVPLRGQSVEVVGIPHGLCGGCGETYLGIDEMEQLQKAAVDQARQTQGLLRPDEIRSLRAELGDISQVRLEHLLGVGAKTVVRWEKGTVFQSADGGPAHASSSGNARAGRGSRGRRAVWRPPRSSASMRRATPAPSR